TSVAAYARGALDITTLHASLFVGAPERRRNIDSEQETLSRCCRSFSIPAAGQRRRAGKRAAPREKNRLDDDCTDEVTPTRYCQLTRRFRAPTALLLKSSGRTAIQHVVNDGKKIRPFNETRHDLCGRL